MREEDGERNENSIFKIRRKSAEAYTYENVTCLANLRPVEVANLSESVRRNRRQLPIGLLEYTVSPATAVPARRFSGTAFFRRYLPARRYSGAAFLRRSSSGPCIQYNCGSRSRRRSEIEKEKTMRSEDVERDDRSRIQDDVKTIPRWFLSCQ